jgi:hypothetical protein
MSIENLGPLLVLGESTGIITLDGSSDFRAAINNMVRQARHRVRIFTQELDHELYDQPDFIKITSKIGRQSKLCEIQILIHHPDKPSRLGHRLVELHRRLPSSILIRELPEDYDSLQDEYLIVDEIGLVKRHVMGYMQGTCEFKSIPDALKRARLFDEIWQRAEPSQSLRRLDI